MYVSPQKNAVFRIKIVFQFVKWHMLMETFCHFVPILEAEGGTPVLDAWDPKLTGLEVGVQSRPKYARPFPSPQKILVQQIFVAYCVFNARPIDLRSLACRFSKAFVTSQTETYRDLILKV